MLSRLALLVNIIGADTGFQAGHSAWILNGNGRTVIQAYVNGNLNDAELSDNDANVIWSVFVSIQVVGQIIGAQLGSYVADKLGRRDTLRWNCLLYLLGNIMQTIPGTLVNVDNLFTLLFLGRFIQTVGVGLGQSVVIAFITEISPTHKRGLYASTYNLYNTIASLLVVILTLPQVAGTSGGWPWLMLIPVPTTILWFITSFYIPEPPRQLLYQEFHKQGIDGDIDHAIAIESVRFYDQLTYSEATEEAAKLAQLLRLELRYSTARQTSWTRGARWYDRGLIGRLRRKELRIPFIILFTLAISRALSGYNIIFSYSADVLKAAGLDTKAADWGSIMVAAVRLAFSIPLGYIIEKWGRKWPIIGSNWAIVTCFVILCASTEIWTVRQGATTVLMDNSTAATLPETSKGTGIAALVALLIWPAAFVLGIGTVHRFVCAEIFAQSDRAIAQRLLVQLDALLSLIYTFAFLPLLPIMHGYIYLLVIVPMIPLSIFTSLYLPETKNREIAVIVAGLNRKSSTTVRPDTPKWTKQFSMRTKSVDNSRLLGKVSEMDEDDDYTYGTFPPGEVPKEKERILQGSVSSA